MPFKRWNPGCPCCEGDEGGTRVCGSCEGIPDTLYADIEVAYRRWESPTCVTHSVTAMPLNWQGLGWSGSQLVSFAPSGIPTSALIQVVISCSGETEQVIMASRYRADCTGAGQASSLITVDSTAEANWASCQPFFVEFEIPPPSGAQGTITVYEL
jgi:hypothetical protein